MVIENLLQQASPIEILKAKDQNGNLETFMAIAGH